MKGWNGAETTLYSGRRVGEAPQRCSFASSVFVCFRIPLFSQSHLHRAQWTPWSSSLKEAVQRSGLPPPFSSRKICGGGGRCGAAGSPAATGTHVLYQMPAGVLAAPLPVQPLANASCQAAEAGSSARALDGVQGAFVLTSPQLL